MTWATIGVVVIINILVFAAILLSVWMGFRMGRRTADKPMPPIIKTAPWNMTFEDPWHKPMTGDDQPSYPTVEEKR